MMTKVIMELQGRKPGPECPAYNKHKNREHCQKTKCRYYQNHRVSPITGQANEDVADVDADLNAISVKTAKILPGLREIFEIHEECQWHCVKFDQPSKFVTLPWENE